MEFYLNEHNTKMPHPAFGGQTPDEMYFWTATNLPVELVVAKSNSRTHAWPPIARCLASAASSRKPPS
jgi:hypothetical protein